MKNILTIDIEKIVYGGRGLGRAEGKVVFVPFTAPGDRVEAEIVSEKRDYAEGITRTLLQASPRRVNPFCPAFGDCGGCQLQHLSYAEQLKAKEAALQENLGKLKRKRDFESLPIIPSPEARNYRIRAQFKAGLLGKRKILGFYAWKTHRVVEIGDCPMLHPAAGRIRKEIESWMNSGKGVILSGADVQVSPDEERGVAVLHVSGPVNREMGQEIMEAIPGLKGVVLQGEETTFCGEMALEYDWPGMDGCGGLRLRNRGDSFFQVNPGQNRNLRESVLEWAALTGRENVLDLFCGSGNLTLPLARMAGRVWGIDQDEQAIRYGAENARENGILNCSFLAGGAEEGLRRLRREAASLDVAVLDPPRTGASGVLDVLTSFHPQKILYVSCEPPTLVRDLARLEHLGYNLCRVQPLDMFPHAYHLEVIAECRRLRES